MHACFLAAIGVRCKALSSIYLATNMPVAGRDQLTQEAPRGGIGFNARRERYSSFFRRMAREHFELLQQLWPKCVLDVGDDIAGQRVDSAHEQPLDSFRPRRAFERRACGVQPLIALSEHLAQTCRERLVVVVEHRQHLRELTCERVVCQTQEDAVDRSAIERLRVIRELDTCAYRRSDRKALRE